MKNKFALLVAASSFILLQSCRTVYTPNMQNVPLFREKNELRGTLGLTNYQAAYAVSDHVGIMVNGQYRKVKYTNANNQQDENTDHNKKTLLEGGAGYYHPISNWGVFEIYGGGGIGSVSFDRRDSQTGVTFDKYFAKTSRFFIQPSIGFTNEYLDFAFSLRVLRLKFFDADVSQYSNSPWYESDLRNLDQFTYTFTEPALTLRLGWENVKFHFQGILSFATNSNWINYFPIVINTGIHINLAKRFSEKKSSADAIKE